MKPILEIHGIGKKYPIAQKQGAYVSLRERLHELARFNSANSDDFWALQNVSFTVDPGESIGIIGRNGAGKSTLLKILSRITRPTTGRIVCRGRIASLLEVGTGFHPELTGRENVYLNGSLLGMKKKEIDNKFDEIVAFSSVEKFLDTPLKHYSSGMQLRLAFSVAAFLEPEILIIDEVLAVGDAEFQKKCVGKMEDVTKQGRTILFVSHNLAAISNLCRNGILLDQGHLIKKADMDAVATSYQASFSHAVSNEWRSSSQDHKIYVTQINISLHGQQPNHYLMLDFGLKSQERHSPVFIAFDVVNSTGITVMQAIPKSEPFIDFDSAERSYRVKVDLPPLIPDMYRLSVWLGPHNSETFFWEKEIVAFEILDSPCVGRNFPHSQNNGFLIATSTISNA